MSTQDKVLDKDQHFGRYQSQEDKALAWKNKLHEKVVHKALDMPMDDDVNVNVTKTGLSALGAIGIAAGGGIPALILAALAMFGNKVPTQIINPPAIVQPSKPDGSAWDAVVEELQPNGTWKEIDRHRLTPPK